MADELTRREREVLQLVAAGLSGREIAARLCISERTVRSHAGRMCSKLGVRNRVELVMAAQRAGLLDGALSTTSLLVALQRELERAQTHLARAKELLRSNETGQSSAGGRGEPHGKPQATVTMRL